MRVPFLGLIFGGLIAGTAFEAHRIQNFLDSKRLVSWTAGVSLSYIFLDMIPYFYRTASSQSFMFLFPLLGFSIPALTEEVLGSSENSLRRLKKYSLANSLPLVLYYSLVGYAISVLSLGSFIRSALFLGAFLLNTATGRLSPSNWMQFSENKFWRLTLVSSIMLGVLSTYYLSAQLLNPVIGILTGVLLYSVVSQSYKGETGNLIGYVLGALIYLIAIIGL